MNVRNAIVVVLLALSVGASAADHRNFTIVGRHVVVTKPAKTIVPTVWKSPALTPSPVR